MSDERPPVQRPPLSPLALAGLGVELAAPVVLFMFGGYKLDGWLGHSPLFTVLGALLGIAVGFYSFFRRVLAAGRTGGTE